MQAAAPLGEWGFDFDFVFSSGALACLLRTLLDRVMQQRSARKEQRPWHCFPFDQSTAARCHSFVSFRSFLNLLLLLRKPNTSEKNRALHRQHGAPRPPLYPRGKRRRVQRRERRREGREGRLCQRAAAVGARARGVGELWLRQRRLRRRLWRRSTRRRRRRQRRRRPRREGRRPPLPRPSPGRQERLAAQPPRQRKRPPGDWRSGSRRRSRRNRLPYLSDVARGSGSGWRRQQQQQAPPFPEAAALGGSDGGDDAAAAQARGRQGLEAAPLGGEVRSDRSAQRTDRRAGRDGHGDRDEG